MMICCSCLLLLALAVAVPVDASTYNSCSLRSGSYVKQPSATSLPRWDAKLETFFDDYRQLVDINAFLDQLQASHGDYLEIKELGRSSEDRPLRALHIADRGVGTPDVDDRPVVYLQAGIHAREWIAPATLLYVAKYLLEHLSRGDAHESLTQALRSYLFILVPVVNPDGYVFTWEENRMWRKTRSNSGTLTGNCVGVDPNRNWDFMWRQTSEQDYAADLRDPCTNVYAGAAAFSEPEVRAVADFLMKRQLRSLEHAVRLPDGDMQPGPGYVVAFFDYHAFAQMLLPPWSHTDRLPSKPDWQYQSDLTEAMGQAILDSSGRVFKRGSNLMPKDPGTAADWGYGALGVRATMTVELEGDYWHSDGFCWPSNAIRSVGKEQAAALVALVEHLRKAGDKPSRYIGPLETSVWQQLPLGEASTSSVPQIGTTSSSPQMTTTPAAFLSQVNTTAPRAIAMAYIQRVSEETTSEPDVMGSSSAGRCVPLIREFTVFMSAWLSLRFLVPL
eukprot:TRINITY_DN33424_c0_g1_i1.p1 TRINITY_DN33424_c0_g1~~TRINITY_DN33424_c0_g1_i1.p1  ORF type:complete len:503 (+),score=78.48 TRINITY_DN33424_c0_g1_i1:85-1593(+)